MYDWANSSFATTVMAGFFPLFFKQYWNVGVAATESTFRLGLANGIASFIVAFMAPLIGAIADKGGARVRLLVPVHGARAAMTVGCYLVGKGDWLTAAILYVVASLGFWGGNQFYDSLLTDVAEEQRVRPRVRIRICAGLSRRRPAVSLNVLMVTKPAMFGLADAGEARALVVRDRRRLVGGVHAVPLMLVRERPDAGRCPPMAAIRAGRARVARHDQHIWRRYGRCCGSCWRTGSTSMA